MEAKITINAVAALPEALPELKPTTAAETAIAAAPIQTGTRDQIDILSVQSKLAICTTVQQAHNVWWDYPDEESEAAKLAVDRINELAPAELAICTTFNAAVSVAAYCPEGSEAHNLAVTRINELLPEALNASINVKMASFVHQSCQDVAASEGEKLALDRINELLPEGLAACTTLREAELVEFYCPSGSEAKKLAMARIEELKKLEK